MAAEVQEQTRIPVWLDCDPGHDDAFAIILAAYNPKIHLLGISTVAGNVSVERTTANTLHVLHLAGIQNVPVVQGQARPLLRPPLHCPEIHGKSGLDGVDFPPLPEGLCAVPGKAVTVMFEAIKKAHDTATALHGTPTRVGRGLGHVVLVATGALTNVALLLALYPEVVPCLRDIVIMGGAIGIGNTSPAAEFNIEIDPEAAAMVFASGLVTMVPLEVTHTALVTPTVLDRLAALGSPFSVALERLLLHFKTTYKRVFDFDDPPLHDPCAVAYVIAPHLFKGRAMHVAVDTGTLCAGRTVCDLYDRMHKIANATVTTAMDVEAFWLLMLEACSVANTHSLATFSL
eukprot:m.235643 g.235643  ORF g.235643 m.235643 type:complete len:345 (+) comp20180_c0_seq1:20-1054(+)